LLTFRTLWTNFCFFDTIESNYKLGGGEMGNLIVRAFVAMLAVLVVFVGLLAIAVVLGWMDWDGVWDVSGKAALVGLIVFLIVMVVSGLMAFLPKADTDSKGKNRR
jgi:ABC-type multidrug transport system fused ATPase/permease subunit